ncbi:MAG TPA: hypothetical protein VGN52_12085 [Burkholderiales bacterium]
MGVVLNLICLAVCFCGGVVLHRWLARRWFGALEDLSEQEILAHGLLVSVLLNGAAGTWLALFHLFHPLAFAVFFAACLLLLHEDTRRSLAAARLALFPPRGAIAFSFLRPLALLCWLLLAAQLVGDSFLPTANIDAWAFQLPLATSIVEHHGFVYPQIGHPFYSNQPLFMNVLFAEAYSLWAHFAAASLASVMVYLLMFVSLAAMWGRSALALLLLLHTIGANPFFTSQVATVLTDMPRSCVTVLGLCSMAHYFGRRIPYYAGLAAICIGAAVATKFTELVSLGLCGLMLTPSLLQARGRALALKCAVVVAAIAGYWYVKNLILLGNPLYPFLFGHPGLSDAWMSDYMNEMTRPFYPGMRYLDHNLLSVSGWRDMLGVLWKTFFEGQTLAITSLMLGIVGAARFPRRIAPLLLTAGFLFVFWYKVMFNHVRWAIPADMMLYVTGCNALMLLAEQYLPWWTRARIHAILLSPPLRWLGRPTLRIAGSNAAMISIVAAAAILNYAMPWGHHPPPVYMRILDKTGAEKPAERMFMLIDPHGLDRYLGEERDGYTLYRYVTQNNLHRVFQPYDNGVKLYANAYNGGRPGDWFIDIGQTPAELGDVQSFVSKNQIAYFIARDNLQPVEIERLGPEKLATAARVIAALKPGAQLLLEDANGWRLYHAGPAGAR